METNANRELNPNRAFRLPAITPLSLIIELAIIVAAALLVTRPYFDFTPTMRISGNEAEYLMSSDFTMASAYRTLGYIPLWQPWLAKGEPLVSSPFSMLFNPLSSVPSFFLGSNNGVKLTLILTIIFSGIGGWVLGRVLGFRALARLLLGVLCVARGSLHGVLLPGFFPLTMSQAHFPWLFAGAIGVLWYRNRRWPIVMTALMFCLMFWVGLMWYVPAITLALVLLTLAHSFAIHRYTTADGQTIRQFVIDWVPIKRMAFAAALTLGLSMITFLPLLAFRSNFGISTVATDPAYSISSIVDLYFNGAPKPEFGGYDSGAAFYSFISPWWYIGVLLVGVIAVSLMKKSGSDPNHPWMLRWVVVVGLIVIAFYTLWGAGLNPLIEWSYDHIPLANTFRHVERVLGVGAFWISIVMAAAVDYIWVRLRTASWRLNAILPSVAIGPRTQALLAVGLIVASGVASEQVLEKWHVFGTGVQPEVQPVDTCLAWLRKTNPDAPLAAWTKDYSEMTAYLKYGVRHFNILTDFYKPSPIQSTLYMNNISEYPPQYAQTWGDWDYSWMTALGYKPSDDIPLDSQHRPCFYTRDSYYPYAFEISKDVLTQPDEKLDPSQTTTITTYKRNYDWIALVVGGNQDSDQVVAIQELAFPGWTVQVNGAPAKLDVVGGVVAVVLPAGTTQYNILFQYRPSEFFIGAAITLITWLICVAFLLRAERLIPRTWWERANTVTRDASVKAVRFMLNPNVIGTDEIERPAPLIPPDGHGPILLPASTPEPSKPAVEIGAESSETPDDLDEDEDETVES